MCPTTPPPKKKRGGQRERKKTFSASQNACIDVLWEKNVALRLLPVLAQLLVKSEQHRVRDRPLCFLPTQRRAIHPGRRPCITAHGTPRTREGPKSDTMSILSPLGPQNLPGEVDGGQEEWRGGGGGGGGCCLGYDLTPQVRDI